LFVGSLVVCGPDEVDEEVITLFRGDMAHVERVSAERYEEFRPGDEPFTDAYMFRAPGRVIADRLDLMGIDAAHVLADLEQELRYQAGPVDKNLLDGCDEETRAWVSPPSVERSS